MSSDTKQDGVAVARETAGVIDRREAIRRVSAMLGGVAFIGGTSLLTACERDRSPVAKGDAVGDFSAQEIAFLDEVADTILPTTSTPGAKAAQTGAFMALMVKDTYDADQQKVFRDGMRALDDRSKQMNGGKGFMEATPQQRLALLTELDREQKTQADRRDAAYRARMDSAIAGRQTAPPTGAAARRDSAQRDTSASDAERAAARLPDQRQEQAKTAEAGTAAAVTQDEPTHYFRMMKELAMLGYFTSEIGYTQAMRYAESPGRFDPCAPYAPGDKAWAPHA